MAWEITVGRTTVEDLQGQPGEPNIGRTDSGGKKKGYEKTERMVEGSRQELKQQRVTDPLEEAWRHTHTCTDSGVLQWWKYHTEAQDSRGTFKWSQHTLSLSLQSVLHFLATSFCRELHAGTDLVY